MRELGIAGAVRGKRVITTIPAAGAERAPDLVDRDFVAPAPNRCWVADFTHVTSQTIESLPNPERFTGYAARQLLCPPVVCGSGGARACRIREGSGPRVSGGFGRSVV